MTIFGRSKSASAALLAALLGLAGPSGVAIAADDETGPVAKTTAGAVRGARDGGVVSFKGIPYAAPPVGTLRWRAPQPPRPWPEIRPALEHGHVCPQQPNPKDNGVGVETPSEDCLVLSVWSPSLSPPHPLPVLVWIHGGGFVNGSGSAALYDGSNLARQDVVVVTLNYRLGRLGFFAHPALTREAGSQPVGNYGMLDMIAALEWVKGNIGAFGGDPDKVTVFGESAGGAAVNRLMISPAARGLFHRAIAQSGAGRESARLLRTGNAAGQPSAEAAGLAFARTLGVEGDDAAALQALRELPAERIISAPFDVFGGDGPIIDGRIITMDVADAFRRGAEAQIPYLVGFNSVEAPIRTDQLATVLGGRWSEAQQAELAAIYPDAAAFARNVLGDTTFAEPARLLAALHAGNGAPTYLYRFAVVSASMRHMLTGTPHAQERQYVFRTLETSPWPTDANDASQAALASAYWTEFAKTGDPNGGGRTRWSAYDAGSDRLLDFTNDGPVMKAVPFAERMDAIAAWRTAEAR